jgi:glycosyltransferase involved in cell wall biosynthesis
MSTVSVVIPAYNSARYLEQAVDAALSQTGVSLEVVVIDDGSTDDTGAVLERFGDRIRKVSQANGGPASARNHGARLAGGEWLAFLDADDDWAPNKLACQLARADDQTGLVYTDCIYFGDSGRVTERQSDGLRLLEGDIFEELLLENFITLSSVLIRKRDFDRLGGFDESPPLIGVEDWDLWLRYAAVGKVGLCPDALTRYRWHAGGTSRRLDHMNQGRRAVIRRALDLPRGRRVSRSLARRAYASAWQIAGWYAAATQPGKAIWWYVRALCCWPWNVRPYKEIVKCCLGRN